MILGKIMISGPNQELNDGIIDAVFAYLKSKDQPAIFLDNYEPDGRTYIVGDTFIVCQTKAAAKAA